MILTAILSALGLGGLGVATYLLGPAVMLGYGKSLLGLLGKIPWQVWAIGGAALVLVYTIHDRNKWKDRAAAYNAEAAADFEAAKAASGNPKLDRKDTAKQIAELGSAVTTLRKSLADQNAAVAALGAKSAEQQEEAAQALQGARERVSEAEGVAARYRAESLSAAGKSNRSGVCEPDPVVKEQWQ